MADLSPSALAILQAFNAAADDGVRAGSERRGIAAVLCRAAWQCEFQADTLKLLALADEIESPAPDAL
jgi:hypothetical protein